MPGKRTRPDPGKGINAEHILARLDRCGWVIASAVRRLAKIGYTEAEVRAVFDSAEGRRREAQWVRIRRAKREPAAYRAKEDLRRIRRLRQKAPLSRNELERTLEDHMLLGKPTESVNAARVLAETRGLKAPERVTVDHRHYAALDNMDDDALMRVIAGSGSRAVEHIAALEIECTREDAPANGSRPDEPDSQAPQAE